MLYALLKIEVAAFVGCNGPALQRVRTNLDRLSVPQSREAFLSHPSAEAGYLKRPAVLSEFGHSAFGTRTLTN